MASAPYRFQPPFQVKQNSDAFWIEDAAGLRFAYVYYRDPMDLMSTSPRPDSVAARRMVTFLLRQVARAANEKGPAHPTPSPSS